MYKRSKISEFLSGTLIHSCRLTASAHPVAAMALDRLQVDVDPMIECDASVVSASSIAATGLIESEPKSDSARIGLVD